MTLRLLAVEDSATQAEALRVLLEEQGYDVTLATSAEAALDLLGTSEFDLVLSDVMMPGITGYELCSRIKQDPRLRRLPVVLLTSLADPMAVVRGLECGADNYITKPYDPEHLFARLRHVLDNRRFRQDAKTSVGVTVRFMGRELLINSDREQILDLFISSVEDIVRANEALERSQRELAEAHEKLDAYARDKSEEAKISSHRYRALLQNAASAIFVLDRGSRILDYNPRALEMFGILDREVLNESLADVLGAEGRELVEGLANLTDRSPTWETERRVPGIRGEDRWYGIRASRTEIDGDVLVLLIINEVTDRKQAEESLRQSERQLQEAQQIANIGSFEWNLVTGEQAWSDQLCRILGHAPGARITYEEFLDQLHPEDRGALQAALRGAQQSGEPFFAEFRLRRKDSAERVVQGRGAVEADPDGTVRRVTGTIQDITDRKLAERAQLEREEAERANRAKSEFLSRMSHELRSPLNAILGFAQLLGMDELQRAQRESVDQITLAGRHLLQLINEVLDISRIEAGKLSLSLEPVEVAEIVREAVGLMDPLAQERGIRLTSEIGPESELYVRADSQRLKQIILNFISNGIKYNRRNGEVRIFATEDREGHLRIVVQDTGPGLRPEKLEKLFVPFQRLTEDATEIEGTGLGLSIAKGLAEAMGGEIGVESEPGQGSSFWVEVQNAESPDVGGSAMPAAGSSERPARVQTWHGRRTLLYIEDNPSNLRLVERLLAPRPEFNFISAMQGRHGLELARKYHPHLILLDLNLPDLSGEEVLREIRSDPDLQSIPVVVLTADALAGQSERLRNAGADDYITKPLDVERCLKVIYRLLNEQEAGDTGGGGA